MSAFPKGDLQFRNVGVRAVQDETNGWSITGVDGWSFYFAKPWPINPRAGMVARFYGKGIGYPVRGLFVGGVKVFYRTAAEDEQFQLEETYGRDVKAWLARWDAGSTVWSVEMGGLGPSYEQCLQLAIVEVVRYCVLEKPDASRWSYPLEWQRFGALLERNVLSSPAVQKLGLSGAQWGAAVSLASQLYRFGPIEVFTQPALKDRLIQIKSWFPVAAVTQTNPGSR